MEKYQYKQSLPNTPLDIIGDVHGEWEALQSLLLHLGYQLDGSHPEGRHLVIVGDLCDRGPDSPAVLSWFKKAYDAGHAYMVLGNHELNALVHDPKDGSGWFFPERQEKDDALYAPWQKMDESAKPELLDWLAQQPLILERSDIRIVHAAWIPKAIDALNQANNHLVEQYQYYDSHIQNQLSQADWYAQYQSEQQQYAAILDNPNQIPPILNATAQYEWQRSLLHPIRTLTSGVEEISPEPFYAGGRWRYTCRSQWWQNYWDSVPVIIGHYWRNWFNHATSQGKESLMPKENNAWFGAKNNVFCIDYSVGARWRDRKQGLSVQQSRYRLAALRWPERTLVFDDGEIADTIHFLAR